MQKSTSKINNFRQRPLNFLSSRSLNFSDPVLPRIRIDETKKSRIKTSLLLYPSYNRVYKRTMFTASKNFLSTALSPKINILGPFPFVYKRNMVTYCVWKDISPLDPTKKHSSITRDICLHTDCKNTNCATKSCPGQQEGLNISKEFAGHGTHSSSVPGEGTDRNTFPLSPTDFQGKPKAQFMVGYKNPVPVGPSGVSNPHLAGTQILQQDHVTTNINDEMIKTFP